MLLALFMIERVSPSCPKWKLDEAANIQISLHGCNEFSVNFYIVTWNQKQFLEDGGSSQISPFYKLIKLPEIVILLWSRISNIRSQLQHPTAIMCSALFRHSHTIILKTAGVVSAVSAFQLFFTALWLELSVPDRKQQKRRNLTSICGVTGGP